MTIHSLVSSKLHLLARTSPKSASPFHRLTAGRAPIVTRARDTLLRPTHSLAAIRFSVLRTRDKLRHRAVRFSTMAATGPAEGHLFGPYKIRYSEVFNDTDLSLALVNLKPVVPGHCLIIPKRIVLRFQDLAPEEVTDLWMLAQRVGSKIEPHFGASSLTFAVQDGAAAGQTVPHVHIHILPRKFGDFDKNDEVYDKIDEHAELLKEKLDLDKERKVRTPEEMSIEAAELRALFE